MKNLYKLFAIFFLAIAFLQASFAQCDSIMLTHFKPENSRALFHDELSTEQKNILFSYGSKKNRISASNNNEINDWLTLVVTYKIDCFKYKLDIDTILTGQQKVRYLRGLTEVLRKAQKLWKSNQGSIYDLPTIFDAYQEGISKNIKQESLIPVFYNLKYSQEAALINSLAFEGNSSLSECKIDLLRKYSTLYPQEIFTVIKENPTLPFADSLIIALAPKYYLQIYSYSQGSDLLSRRIKKIDNELVRTIGWMASSDDGMLYMPFLDQIIHKKLNLTELKDAFQDSAKYFSLLVKTHIEYSKRMLTGDTAIAYNEIINRIEKKVRDVFVNNINALHEEPNPLIRFRCLQSLNAQDLYYCCVFSDGFIFTSSFVKGIYVQMMNKCNKNGDSLLISIQFFRYRKFIKMASEFNVLNDFLTSFKKPQDAQLLMKSFVSNLEKGKLEDGVDVADSYASVYELNKSLAENMIKNVQENYSRNLKNNNIEGKVIYNILNKIFLSADTLNKEVNISRDLGIPSPYQMMFTDLNNDSLGVIIQIFMYGDKDGKTYFPSILAQFDNNWKIDYSNPQWVVIKSIKGKKVIVYVNRPLPEEKNEDAEAQKSLCKYLSDHNIYPTVTINRGHSYNAQYTIAQMFSTTKIMFMGSCGGYRMVHDILEKTPDAQIISSKQIAEADVNNPFLHLLVEKIRNGKDIYWIPFWQELKKIVSARTVDDYVPPPKNLGALYIKAYNKAMQNN